MRGRDGEADDVILNRSPASSLEALSRKREPRVNFNIGLMRQDAGIGAG